jgi:hypothetical protein
MTIKEFLVNQRFLRIYVITLGISAITVAWTTGGNN